MIMAKTHVVVIAAILFATCLVSGADSNAPAEDDDVLVLGAANFNEIIQANKRVLVEFYAPWCGHCKSLEPEWNRAATTLKEEGLTTVLAKVDTTVEAEIAKDQEVKGLPTIKYFVDGESTPYEGGRTHDAIVKWVRAKELPLVEEIPADGGLEKFLEGVGDNQYAMVAKVAKKSTRAKTYLKAVDEKLSPLVEDSVGSIATVKFGVIYQPKGTDKANSTLAMFRPGFEEPDAKVHRFDGKWVASQIVQFAQAALYPTVRADPENKLDSSLYSTESLQAMGKEGLVAVAVPARGDEAKDAELKKKVVEDTASVAAQEPKWAFTLAFRGSEAAEDKKYSIAVSQGEKKYGHKVDKEPASAKAIQDFLSSVKAGKAKRLHKSAAAPAEPVDADGVTVLVGSTFEEVAMDPEKDVFVEFYAPWCEHCKKLAPVWSSLAKRAKGQGWAKRGVVIAKMDGSENSCDEEIAGYPALVFYPAVKAPKKMSSRQMYGGVRELEKLADFVLEQAHNLEGFEDVEQKSSFNQVQRDLAKKKKKKESGGDEL